jgi:hypothetical protein
MRKQIILIGISLFLGISGYAQVRIQDIHVELPVTSYGHHNPIALGVNIGSSSKLLTILSELTYSSNYDDYIGFDNGSGNFIQGDDYFFSEHSENGTHYLMKVYNRASLGINLGLHLKKELSYVDLIAESFMTNHLSYYSLNRINGYATTRSIGTLSHEIVDLQPESFIVNDGFIYQPTLGARMGVALKLSEKTRIIPMAGAQFDLMNQSYLSFGEERKWGYSPRFNYQFKLRVSQNF